MRKEDRALVNLIQPVKSRSFQKVADLYDCSVVFEDRWNSYYHVAGKYIVLKLDGDSTSFCHELAHHLQYKLGENCYRDTFDDILAFERQAERIAYYLHKAHFYYLHHGHFNAYICQWHKDFLWQWHFGDPTPYYLETR